MAGKKRDAVANPHKYKLLYKLEATPDGVPVDKIPEGMGACDAVLFCSMIYPADGSFSVYFIGKDGRRTDGKDLDDNEMFKVWSLLANRLGASTTLSEGKKKLAGEVWEIIRGAVLAQKEEN